MNAAAIANHLNIAESLIKSIESWANVLFVRFVSGRPKFVSKKVIKMQKKSWAEMSLEEKEKEIDRLERENADRYDQVVGEIGKYIDGYVSEKALSSAVLSVLSGDATVEEAVDRLTNKKIIIKKK